MLTRCAFYNSHNPVADRTEYLVSSNLTALTVVICAHSVCVVFCVVLKHKSPLLVVCARNAPWKGKIFSRGRFALGAIRPRHPNEKLWAGPGGWQETALSGQPIPFLMNCTRLRSMLSDKRLAQILNPTNYLLCIKFIHPLCEKKKKTYKDTCMYVCSCILGFGQSVWHFCLVKTLFYVWTISPYAVSS